MKRHLFPFSSFLIIIGLILNPHKPINNTVCHCDFIENKTQTEVDGQGDIITHVNKSCLSHFVKDFIAIYVELLTLLNSFFEESIQYNLC